jgi:hypothetical protein
MLLPSPWRTDTIHDSDLNCSRHRDFRTVQQTVSFPINMTLLSISDSLLQNRRRNVPDFVALSTVLRCGIPLQVVSHSTKHGWTFLDLLKEDARLTESAGYELQRLATKLLFSASYGCHAFCCMREWITNTSNLKLYERTYIQPRNLVNW